MSTTHVIPGFLRSQRMQTVVHDIEAALGSRAGVLICGESGTGREATARAIHRATMNVDGRSLEDLLSSGRRTSEADASFVVVECGLFRDVEQQMFGSPAASVGREELDRISWQALLCQSFGGTLFLRSVHDMPGRVQARLARVLRDGEVWIEGRDGTPVVAAVNLRVIASIEPPEDDEDGRVIPELKKHLAAHRIELPPLRERREDVPGLVRIHLADICESLKIPHKVASRQVMALLAALPWRGNFKELRGLLRALVLKVPGRQIRLADVLDNIRLDGAAITFLGGGTLKEARERFEREYVAAVLEQHRGRMAEAARALGIQRTNLYRKVRQLSVTRKRPGNRP
jgi:DNA-binding NtrC family response regulator